MKNDACFLIGFDREICFDQASSKSGPNNEIRSQTQAGKMNEDAMLIVHVHVQVKPEHVEAFRLATIENAQASIQESGVARFDVVQQADDATRFVLIEIYRTPEASASTKKRRITRNGAML